MEWIITLLIVAQALTSAADQPSTIELIRQIEAEEAMYASGEITDPSSVKGIYPNTSFPGDAVFYRSQEPGEIEWAGKSYPLTPYGMHYYALLPIPMNTEPGTYTLDGLPLEIKPKAFQESRLTVSSQQEQMRSETERIDADQLKINEARRTSRPEFLYQGSFLVPVEGRLTTPYGFTRYVNGKHSGSHNAIDLAAPTGTPIKATNDGVVVLADELYLTGHSIYIDHGMNLFSQYAHLSEIHVEPGEEVEAGQIIGLVGSTGFSTGPHLHFTFWIGNTPVNPDLFFDTTPFGWMGD